MQNLFTGQFWLRIMRFTLTQLMVAVLFLSISHAHKMHAQELLNQRLTLSFESAEIKKVLQRIEKTTNVQFMYSSNVIKSTRRVSLAVNNERLAVVLESLLTPMEVAYEVAGNRILLKRVKVEKTATPNQTSVHPNEFAPIDRQIIGKVIDESGGGLPGVSVVVKGTAKGAITDSDGKYNLSIPEGNVTLVYSFVGYEAQEVAVGSRTTVDVTLKVDVKALSEVVVVGYGTQNRKDVTGSIASISAQDIKDMPVTNVAEGMAGKLPGVLIQQTTGAPGNSPSVKIRGFGSISAGNGPLIVVDGQPLNSGDLTNGSGLNLMNPNDIESVDVLKDASATAIFGSRGANGVMMITTKRGKAGRSRINFDYYTGVQEISKKMDMLNAQQFAEFSKEASNNAYLERVTGAQASDLNSVRAAGNRYRYPRGEYPGIDFDNPASLNSYDYQNLIFRQAPISSYQLSGSGGTEKIQYMVSGNYLKQDGIINTSGLKRYTFRSNIDAQLSPKLKIGMSVSPSFTTERRVNSDGHWASNGVINAALSQAPIIPIYQADGVTYNSQASIAGAYDWAGVTNPVANITELDNTATTLRLLGNTYADLTIWKTLKYRATFGADLNYFRQNQFQTSAIPLNQLLPPNANSGSSATRQSINWVTSHTLGYNVSLMANHYLDALVGFESQKNDFESNSVNANRFPNDIVRTVNAGVIIGGSSLRDQWSLASYFARVGYTYKDRYLVNASIRRDGSSRFGANQRYGIFPSASIGWRVTEEPFMKNIPTISEMKLKVSYGLAGNNAFSNYGSIGILGADNYVFGNALVNGLATSTIGNDNLTWEKSRQTDIGLELGLWKNRIFFTADYYSRTTTDLLLSVQVPTLTGFSTASRNIGKVENKGMEFGLVTRNTTGNLKWMTDLNISFNRNKVLALGPTGDAIRSGTGVGETNITVIGKPLGNFYGYQQLGVFKDQADLDSYPHDATARPGDVKFADINNDGKINADDRTIIGNNQPDFIYGMTNSLSFKGFDLGITVQGIQGGQILNLSRRFIENLEGSQNQLSTVLNRWRSPQDPGNGVVPRANQRTTGNNNAISSRWVESASYFRVRNITLGYNLPKATLERVKIQSLRLYGGIQNAFTSTKYLGFNPEVSGYENALTGGVDYGSYPLARTYTIGLNIGF
ncbi:TonB-dependent receptor [Runella limosa]|uniref:TonB-dependent receptor n=1 Tax=Runella limosa TaxID=370978 RepID=UPI0004219DD7|nr:TonB-dependent receptor [Runella limosa]